MGAYSLNPEDQSVETPQQPQQAPVQQQPAPQQQQPVQQQAPQVDPEDQQIQKVRQNLMDTIQKNTMPPAQGGAIKRLLSNFVSSIGYGMIPPSQNPDYLKEHALRSLNQIDQTQGTIDYHKQLVEQMKQRSEYALQGKLAQVAASQQNAQTAADSRETVASTNAAAKAAAPRMASAASRDDRFIKLSGVSPNTWTPDDQQFMKGYQKYIDVTKTEPGVARANVFAATRWAALDPQRQAQIAAAKSLAAGPFANQTTSFNAFIGHAGDLNDAFKTLGNTDLKLLNIPLNKLKEQTDPKITSVIAKIEPVRKEFESLLLNNRALYEADRESADKIISENSTPAQMVSALRSMAHTAGIRLGAINSTVKRVTGEDIPDLLEPSNGAIMQELGGDVPGYGSEQQSFGQVFNSKQFKGGNKGAENSPPMEFKEGNDVYRIPANKVARFKQLHPQAVPRGR